MNNLAHNLGTRMGRTWFGFVFNLAACGGAGFIALKLVLNALASGAVPCPGWRCRGNIYLDNSPLLFWAVISFFAFSGLFIIGLALLYALRFLRSRLEP